MRRLPTMRFGLPFVGIVCALVLLSCGERPTPDLTSADDWLAVVQRPEDHSAKEINRAVAGLRGNLAALADKDLVTVAGILGREQWYAVSQLRAVLDELGRRGSYSALEQWMQSDGLASRPFDWTPQFYAFRAVVRSIPDKTVDAFNVLIEHCSPDEHPLDVETALECMWQKGYNCDSGILLPLSIEQPDSVVYWTVRLLERSGYDADWTRDAYEEAERIRPDVSLRLSEKLRLDLAARELDNPEHTIRSVALSILTAEKLREQGGGPVDDFGFSEAVSEDDRTTAVKKWRQWWEGRRAALPHFGVNVQPGE